MRIIYYGEGDPAWAEPENDDDRALIEKAKAENWTFARLMAEAKEK